MTLYGENAIQSLKCHPVRLQWSAGHRCDPVSRQKQEGNIDVIYKRLTISVLAACLSRIHTKGEVLNL